MKRIIIYLAFSVLLLPVAVQGQNPVRISTDTLPCGVRQPNYYYSAWYDTTGWYLLPDDNEIWHARSVYFTGGRQPHTVQQYAPHPIRARGLWVMVSHYVLMPLQRLSIS